VSKSFSEMLKDNGSGGERLPTGMSWDKIMSDIGSELKHQWKMGAHELASTLFTGQAYVQYGRQDNAVDDPQHGLQEKEVDTGREM
jgi:hypothetical protein